MINGDDNLTELRAALRAEAAAVAEALLGAPSKANSTRNTHRWGSKGSLAVEVRGPKRGLWFTHEAGEGKDLLGLIQHVHHCNFPDALTWARNWTGIDSDEAKPFTPRARTVPPEPNPDEAAEIAADRVDKIAYAQRLAAVSVPIAGTPAEYYLKQNRGIPVPSGGWPDVIRWHPVHRAVVAVATTADGAAQAVQRIHVDTNGRKIGLEEQQARRLPSVKLTNGPQDGAAVRLPGDPNGPLMLAEGVETGLAVYTATGFETWIALGSIGKIEPPVGRVVVAISDDNPPAHDARHGQAAKALRKALTSWRRAGVNVVVATPWEVRRWDKSDLADVILHHGRDAVRARVMAALEPAKATVKRVPVEQARDQVAAAVGTFFGRVDALSVRRAAWDVQAKAATAAIDVAGVAPEPAPLDASPAPMDDADWDKVLDSSVQSSEPTIFTHGVRVTVGAGKSHEARLGIARTLAAMRERSDGRTVVLAVPMHALGNEQAANFTALPEVRDAGLRVAIWRGRGALDPDHPDYGHANHARAAAATMCQDLERVNDAQAIGLSAQTAACKRRIKLPDGTSRVVKCPLFDGCAYQAQMHRKADLWITAHTALFHEKPAAMGEIAALVVDEAAWKKGLIGAEGRHITLSLDALNADVAKVPGFSNTVSDGRLQDLRRQLFDAVRGMPDGAVRAASMGATLLTADSAAEAHKLEWSRKVDPLHPGQTRDERHSAMEAAAGNRLIPRMSMAWHAAGKALSPGAPEASGWIEVATEHTKDGPVRVLRLKGRHDIRDGWKVPTLLLDALLPLDLVRPFWPDVELVADVHAEAPHQHVRQVVDRAYSKSMLEQLGTEDAAADSEEARRRANRLHDLRAILIREARKYAPGQVLVVLQQSVEKSLMALGRLPPNLSLAHHNNIAGRDEWRDARAIIVVGRTMPPPSAAERIAEALTGAASSRLDGWYERADAVREMVNGQAIPAEADRHPDALAEMIRWQAAEGELVQIIGRGRGSTGLRPTPSTCWC